MAHHHHHSDDQRRLKLALLVCLVFMVAEAIGGLVAGSMTLLADAGHMLTDAVALLLAWAAARLTARPAKAAFTFGLGRSEIVSAQINGILLLALALVLGFGAVARLLDPIAVDGTMMLVLGLLGLVVNAAITLILMRSQRSSLNLRGAIVHSAYDALASAAAALAGVVILLFSYYRIDGVLALLVCLLMLRGGISLVLASGRVLLEAVPRGLDVDEIGMAMAEVAGVDEIHDLHIWEVTSGFAALSAHVVVGSDDDCHQIRQQLADLLAARFALSHTTLQIEHRPLTDIIDLRAN